MINPSHAFNRHDQIHVKRFVKIRVNQLTGAPGDLFPNLAQKPMLLLRIADATFAHGFGVGPFRHIG